MNTYITIPGNIPRAPIIQPNLSPAPTALHSPRGFGFRRSH